MNRLPYSFLVLFLFGFSAYSWALPPPLVTIGFSPGNAESLVVQTINSAHDYIAVAAYSFTSRPIATALLNAKARGVKVYVMADKSQATAQYTSVRFLANHGVPVRINYHYAIMHNKFMVIDGITTETGSFNYTKAATLHNAENVIVIANAPAVATTYRQEWLRLWGQSVPLAQGGSQPVVSSLVRPASKIVGYVARSALYRAIYTHHH